MSERAFSANATTGLSVTDTTGSVALAAKSSIVLVQNLGAKVVYIKLGDSSVVATTSDFPLGPGAAIPMDQGTFTHIAGICASGESATLKMTSGAGLAFMSLSAQVAISGLTVTTDTEATATAAAPSYSEGTQNNMSMNLAGDLRTIAKQSGTWNIGTVTTVTTVATVTAVTAVTDITNPVTTKTPAGSYTDRTITSLSGSSQQLVASNATRKNIVIQNTGNANVGVSLSGGTAAIGGAATITLAAGASYASDASFVPTNAINVIGTAAQPLAAFEG